VSSFALRIPVVAAVTALALSSPAGPASAGTKAVDEVDATGDVRVFDVSSTESAQPTDEVKQSVDISRFTVTKRARTTRFSFTLAAIVTSKEPYQGLHVTFIARGDDDSSVMAVDASPQLTGYASGYYIPSFEDDSGTSCRVKVSVRETTVRLDLPQRCIMPKPGEMRVISFLGADEGGEDVIYSQDVLRLKGTTTLP
jgi:hypothetical protein